MPIRFTCVCGRHLVAAEKFAGKSSRCPSCGVSVCIPGGDPSGVPRAAAPAAPPSVTPPSENEIREVAKRFLANAVVTIGARQEQQATAAQLTSFGAAAAPIISQVLLNTPFRSHCDFENAAALCRVLGAIGGPEARRTLEMLARAESRVAEFAIVRSAAREAFGAGEAAETVARPVAAAPAAPGLEAPPREAPWWPTAITLAAFVIAAVALVLANYTYSAWGATHDRSGDRAGFFAWAAFGLVYTAASRFSRWVAFGSAAVAVLGFFMVITYPLWIDVWFFWGQTLALAAYLAAIVGSVAILATGGKGVRKPSPGETPQPPGLATAALVLACFPMTAPVGVILSHVARRQAGKRGARRAQRLASGGLVAGYGLTGIQVFMIVNALMAILAAPKTGEPNPPPPAIQSAAADAPSAEPVAASPTPTSAISLQPCALVVYYPANLMGNENEKQDLIFRSSDSASPGGVKYWVLKGDNPGFPLHSRSMRYDNGSLVEAPGAVAVLSLRLRASHGDSEPRTFLFPLQGSPEFVANVDPGSMEMINLRLPPEAQWEGTDAVEVEDTHPMVRCRAVRAAPRGWPGPP